MNIGDKVTHKKTLLKGKITGVVGEWYYMVMFENSSKSEFMHYKYLSKGEV